MHHLAYPFGNLTSILVLTNPLGHNLIFVLTNLKMPHNTFDLAAPILQFMAVLAKH